MYTSIQNLSLHIIFVLSVTLKHLTFTYFTVQFNSVTQSYRTLRWHGLQHARLSCASPTPRTCSNSSPLSRWCHPASHLILCYHLLLLPSVFPSIRVFPICPFFASDGQSIRASPLASVLPVNIQDWFPLGLTGLISLHSKGLSRVFSNTIVQKHQFFGTQLSLWSNSHIHAWLLEKP